LKPVRANPVESLDNLRERVERLLRASERTARPDRKQLDLGLKHETLPENSIAHPSRTIAEFLDFLTAAMPDGDVYLFGGVLRDLALMGRKGFNSDIDLVIEGNWDNCVRYLESYGAKRNKFGGFRLFLGGWPIDIWNARETWAIKQGLVQYRSIFSLTETTVLNWDAILMSWRAKAFIHQANYLYMLRERVLDVVLEANPNPLGMAVRVFRHLSLKNAAKMTFAAADYLAHSANRYTFDEIRSAELNSYGDSVVDSRTHHFFMHLGFDAGTHHIHHRYFNATELLKGELNLSD
jgi:nucleotidyltransferase-like protein